MQLVAVPFTPTYAEYIYLKGRRVLADQMEYLLAHFPRTSPLHDAPPALADVSAEAGAGVVYHVDASYFVFRAYYSMPPDMVDADGNAIHALYGFARFLSDLLESVRPQRIAVAFDHSLRSERSFRNAIFPAYKANREAPPADLERQFGLCREFCRHMGLAEFASAAYEADDIIGTLAARARAAGLRNVLMTRDKDLSQLIRDGDVFWDYAGHARYHYHDIGGRFGVAPERMADFLALTGDAVDNIPGVPGVGKKTAAGLLAAFGSLDELYANIDRVPRLNLRGAAGIAGAAQRPQGMRLPCATADRHRLRRADRRIARRLKPRRPDTAALADFFDAHGIGAILRKQAERIAQARGRV